VQLEAPVAAVGPAGTALRRALRLRQPVEATLSTVEGEAWVRSFVALGSGLEALALDGKGLFVAELGSFALQVTVLLERRELREAVGQEPEPRRVLPELALPLAEG